VTKGISKKLQRDDLLRRKRMQAVELPKGAATPPRAIPAGRGSAGGPDVP
jgi:hypothetical protein